jgi:menaquinone-dependent protoporphyrinogen oxidase
VKILVVYGSTEGQTRKIARFIAERLNHRGHTAALVEAGGDAREVDLRPYRAVLVAASLHQGRFQAAVAEFVSRNREMLNALPTMFVSVSLSAAGHDPNDLKGLDDCVSAFEEQTGWQPQRVHHVAGAFSFTRYGFLKRLALKYIAYRRGHPTDTTRNYELTDWTALQDLTDAFSATLEARQSH